MEPKKAIVVSVKQSTPIQRNLELSCVGELSPDNIHELCDVLHNVVSEFTVKFLFKDLPDDCVWLNVIASA